MSLREWWRRRPLRFRLALWYAVGGTLLLAGFSATLYLYVQERMARPLAYELRRDLADVQRRLTVQPDGKLLWNGREVRPRTPWTTEYPWFELWDENDKLVRRLWPFTENRVQQVPVAPARSRETISIFHVADDIRLRVLSVPYEVPGAALPWTIRLMRIHEPAADALDELRWIIFIALPIVVAFLVIGGYSITRRWLLPLDAISTEANRISAENLSRRLSVENPHDELGQLASVFNVTLDRLEASFDALDRFVADASHELRTPLTTLRSVGEVGLRRSRTVEEYREIIGSMLEEAQRLQLLIGRLLELASAEGGAPDVHRTQLQLDEFVTACVNELAILAETRGQHIAVDTVPCRAHTDPVILRQALQNLIDNAVKYSPDGSTIRVSLRNSRDEIELSVTDAGPGISPENQQHLAKRFFRPDRGRGRSSGGFGLGLSITKAYMRVLRGTLEYEAGQPTGSTFRLRFPK
jgi:two-component system, OmpR family, sensor kinase